MAKQNGSLVKYQPYTLEEAEADKKEIDQAGGSNVFAKVVVGKNKYRVLPPPPGAKRPDGKPATWRRVTHVHYVDVPGVGRAQIVCPRLEAKRACVLCAEEKRIFQHSDKLEAEGKLVAAEADRKRAKKLRAKRRAYANVIDRNHPENGPMVLGMSSTVEDGLVKIRQDEDEGGDFTNPGPDGFDVLVMREGTGEFDTRYEVKRSKNNSPLHEDAEQASAWIANQHNLERYCRVHSDEDIEKILRGEKPGGDDDERPRGKSKPQRTIADDIEDAEVVKDDEDAGDEGDETVTID